MSVAGQDVYLDSYLSPFAPFLTRDDLTDIYVNRPGELWLESVGGTIERVELPALTRSALERLARQVAARSAQGVNRANPLLAASLSDGSRIQIVLPPATRGEIAVAIRRHVVTEMTLEDYAHAGAFDQATNERSEPAASSGRAGTRQSDDLTGKLRAAVRGRQSILISGGTSSGKTTFLNALLREVPTAERLITIEDTPELQIAHLNAVGLLAVRGHLGEANIDAEDLLIASLRMRPDRIILGEIRGREALTFLRAVNTGHPGSLSTIHADSPERAIDQLALLVLQSGVAMGWIDVTRYVRNSLDWIIQLERRDGMRRIASVLDVKATLGLEPQ